MTLPRESPTRMTSQCRSTSAAVCAWYDVSMTMGSPPFRAKISGAVLRLIAACTDMSGSDDGNADHGGMEGKGEREIGDDADRDRDQVVGRPTHRNRRP